MICAFRQQDVSEPCRTLRDLRQRAGNHIESCGHALERRDGGRP